MSLMSTGTLSVNHHLLDATMEPIPCPSKSPSPESISLQFREKQVVRDQVKCFTAVPMKDICSPFLVH